MKHGREIYTVQATKI